MPAYDRSGYAPPAPVAEVKLTIFETGKFVDGVKMLLDTGADVSLVPKSAVASLVSELSNQPTYELEGFDVTRSSAPAIQLELLFVGKVFRGQFLLIDSPHGILGRNILNRLALQFDGPDQSWQEVSS